MIKRIEIFCLFCFVSVLCYSQSISPVAGGEATGSDGIVSYTVGQVAYSYSTGINGSFSEGVQQPYEIYLLPTGEDKLGYYPELSVYPNPAADYLLLKVKNFTQGNLVYQLYNLNGKLLESKKLVSIETIIPMDELVRSVYFLKIIDNNTEVKTFKIVKN